METEKTQEAGACGLDAALGVIGGKWKSTIVWELHLRPGRFGELRRRVPGISEKVLYEQLRQLEADGVIRREAFDEVPLRVEYSLTSAGASLNRAVHALAEWGRMHAWGSGSTVAAAGKPQGVPILSS
ncbi:helix-turn-helix domain-containing protein [Sphingosinicella sp. CPCC 101087]|uniref:winged helix-turn-helix transcriptional regulator n=1 Tax=Sphingosinicella sp. CPCC 101087 TaxID=2497754 RepID=UPI00101C369B|nr:helix-turn-helix domain-containing protein [Sphingosinicella sp. CPCC 101087]